jgi:two-component system, cell cycle sensor histidine kinase and response regulator CckA
MRAARLRQEILVRGSVALLVFVFNEINHGGLLIRLVSLVAMALNLSYYLAARGGWLARGQGYTRLVFDIVLTTLGLYGAGGLLAAPYLSIYMVTPIYVAFAVSGGACLFAAGLATVSFLIAGFVQHATSSSSQPIPQTAWSIAIFNLLLLNVVAGLTAVLAAAYRRSRRQLADSEQCFRSIAEVASDAILVVDGQGVVVVSSRAAEAVFGYSQAEILHLPLRRLVRILADGADPRPAPDVQPIEAVGVRKDGAEFPVELRVGAWTSKRGGFSTCIVRDLTTHRQIEERARESDELLRAVVLSSPVAVWAHRFDGGLTIWNPAAARMFGWTADEVLGQYPPFVPESRLSESYAIFERALAGEELMNVNVRRRRKDGAEIDISISSAPLRNTDGSVAGIVTLALDVTERRRLEDQNRQLQKLDTLGSLAGGIAHDFNNLMSIVTGRAHILRQSLEPSSPLRRHVDLINDTAGRAAMLTQQLLAFSRKQVFSLSVLKLRDVVHGLEPILQRLIGEDVELFVSHGPDIGWVKGDRGQLEQVMLNLVVNAREAMPTGGMINVEIFNVDADAVPVNGRPEGWSGPCVVLKVTDTGVGMDEATRSRIFEPFFTTKEVGKGTGLGLSTVYGIVKQHGGSIAVESAPDRGATFTVFLPQVAAPEPLTESAPPVGRPKRGSERILLVEDDAQVRTLTRELLEAHGYSVLEAALPTTALQIAERARVDLVLTDVVMPQMRGAELVEGLVTLQPQMAVLLMSGYPDDPTKDGTPPLITLKKPLAPDVLLLEVRAALDRRAIRRSRMRRTRASRPGPDA